MTREEILAEYIRDIEEQRIPRLRDEIGPYERGEMQIREHTGGAWVDISQRVIDQNREAVAQYEAIVARLRKELA